MNEARYGTPSHLFGAKFHAIGMQDTVHWIDTRISARRFTQHVVINVAKLVSMQKNAALAESVNGCDIVNVDGMGVVWGARWLGKSVPERVAGVDLFEELIALAASRGYPVYLLGGVEGVADAVAVRLRGQHPTLQIAGIHHGYFWEDEAAMVDTIRQSGARMLFVAITSPRKEVFIQRWRTGLGVDFVMGVGGTFDVVAGRIKRAPRWMQRTGLEWLFRLAQEPRRMWRRYLGTNAVFAWMLLKAKTRRTRS
ncbi:WecB/TagA/CpsF family glycosyltransferase [Ralstonia sp. R-29]|uniref:WecB/TagA/CpsF family glycosyltransferase n=1 Tax=Ralstonia sp. R-29 TaxID=3404059 RepID=UPI003CF8295B